ncbi:unnamed protein product [Miscanthus lutarioriparius]|uniref:C2H2-type domain-containing protein n=1 Tax=Miscanthus lutarioriparius TaxID=422564 RepID=A0A811PFW9_9POAL|nr:unnamed protein product [Miscanthus lutarioriparius]
MDSSSDAHGRHKCAACFRQFNKMEHLVEHMRAARHSSHEPRCDICRKHCRSFEAAANCADAFASRGCIICLRVLASAAALGAHRAACRLSRTPPPMMPRALQHHQLPATQPQGVGCALALGCKMVGAGSDGSLDVCARVCVIDEQENILFEALLKPLLPVTHYRSGVEELLLGGEQQPWKVRTSLGRARLLVGHGLDHDLDALGMDYPAYLKRDTATYPPLMKTSKLSNSLRFLTLKYLGYEIQTGRQHPFEDCVAAMRLYRRMRGQQHPRGGRDADAPAATADQAFPAWRQRELERMTPEELLRLSTPDYHCWCLDA